MQGVRHKNKNKKIILSVGLLAAMLLSSWVTLTEARVGRGGSLGGRGSRSFSAPVRPSTPPPGSAFDQRSTSPYGQRAEDPFPRSTPPFSPYAPYGGGSFWRSIGGGLLGGFLGAMLFRSLGFAGYGPGGYGGGWGGPGLFDLLLLGLIGYVAYRFIFKHPSRIDADSFGARASYDNGDRGLNRYAGQKPVMSPPFPQERDLEQGIAQLRVLDPEFDPARFCDQAMDFFFRLQAAWSARDVRPLRASLTEDLFAQLQADADQLRREGKINRVENIAVRTTQLTEAWQETGQDFVTVYFYANCLDYDVDEATGEAVRGSRLEPTKFEEYWTFTRPAGDGSWRLSAITQA